MKVLQEGIINGWEIERQCTGLGHGGEGCGARLLVEEKDVFAITKDKKEYTYNFVCPCCNETTKIPERFVPLRVQSRLKLQDIL